LLLALLLGVAAFPALAAKRVLNGKIAFVSDRDGNSEIYVMDPDGSDVTRLTNDPAGDLAPAWSPDGRRIAFVRNREIVVMNADGTGVTQLTDGRCCSDNPAWSPDGRSIAFDSTSDTTDPEIYVIGGRRHEPYPPDELPG
jgi:Tol biopolymer transport system component